MSSTSGSDILGFRLSIRGFLWLGLDACDSPLLALATVLLMSSISAFILVGGRRKNSSFFRTYLADLARRSVRVLSIVK